MSFRNWLKTLVVSDDIEAQVNRMPKPVGSFGYDPWGYNTDAVKIWLSVLRPFYEKYFRVEAFGLENVPKKGRLLLVGNHSGQIPIDGVMVGYALATSVKGPRTIRIMVERWFSTMPFIGNLMNQVGAVLGDPENCRKMLQNEEAIIVFPEGARGSGKTWDKRYQLQHFGLGFMHLAITENTPIVPVGIVGCEETMPTPMHFKPAAKWFGVPYVPVTLPVMLPSKVRLYFGKPMRFDGPITSEEDMSEKVDQVKEAINVLIQEGLASRNGWFE